jgi:flagellar basal-body rod protein FlgG
LYSGPYEAVIGCRFQELRFDTISNNLANAATAGFKKDMLTFDEALQVRKTTNLTQGALRRTDGPLDVALAGDGFFKVDTPRGVRYTRSGNFVLNAAGLLTTQTGDQVLGSSGPISIEGSNITIDAKGGIAADGSQVDSLSIAVFERPELLQKEGLSYYIYEGDEGDAQEAEHTSVNQGYLEESNVVVAEEMTRMIEALRTFESYQKVLQAFDEADAKVVNEVGSVR